MWLQSTLASPLTPMNIMQTVHFIRHGEGFHNIGFDDNLDAHLTPFGWTQAHALNDHLQALQRPPDIQVLLLSPCSDARKAMLLPPPPPPPPAALL